MDRKKSGPSGELSPRSKLRTQLTVIDRAIEILATDSAISPSRKRDSERKLGLHATFNPQHSSQGPPSTLQTSVSLPRLLSTKKDPNLERVEADRSYRIETSTQETVTCPDCLEQVDIKTFKLHEARLCSNRVITCPNAGCSVKLHAINLKRHLQDECVISQHRRNLLQQADLRLKQQQEQERQRENEARQREAQMLAKLHAENAARAQLSQSTLPSSTFAGQEPEQSPEPVQEIPAASICSQCGEGVRESQLAVHMRSHCHFRLIMCPHFGNGCDNEKVPYALINEHLRDDCDAEKVRAILIQKSRLRQELVQCATCGVKVKLADWRRHERELCANRLVPCRNHALGCPVMVPLLERGLHEHVDENYSRTTLYFPGHVTHVHIDEGDIAAPWTAEFWLYRPHATEALKHHVINAFLCLSAYETAYNVELLAHEQVMQVVRALKDDRSGSNSAQQKMQKEELAKLSKQERQQWQKDQAAQKVALVNSLTGLIPMYADAMLGYLRAFQAVAVQVEAALAAAREVKYGTQPEPWNLGRAFSLRTELPGEQAQSQTGLGNFAAPAHGATPPTTAGTSAHHPGDGSVANSALGQQSYGSNTTTSESRAQSASGGERGGPGRVFKADDQLRMATFLQGKSHIAQLFQYATKHVLRRMNEALQESIRQREAALLEIRQQEQEQQEQKGEEESKELNKNDAEALNGTALVKEVGAVAEELKEASSVEVESAKQDEQDGDAEEDSYAPSLLPPPLQILEQEEDEIAHMLKELSRWLGEWSLQALNSSDVFFYHFLQAPAATLFPSATNSDDEDVSGNPLTTLTSRTVALTIDQWQGILTCLAKALKRDFDILQGLRIDAGLLTPEAGAKKYGMDMGRKQSEEDGGVTPGGKPKKTEEEIEKSKRKKEKERQRREMRKNKKMLDGDEETTDNKVVGTVSSPTSSTPTSRPTTANQSAKSPKSPKKTAKKDETTGNEKGTDANAPKEPVKLITRVTELFRTGCGAEVLSEGNTVNGDGNRCRVITSMFSGLNLLVAKYEEDSKDDEAKVAKSAEANADNGADKPAEEEESEEDKHHYELLMHKTELFRLLTFQGQIGLVVVPQPTSTSTTKLDRKAQKKQALLDSLGTQVTTFNAKLLRGKWTHLALVSQKTAGVKTPKKGSRKRLSKKAQLKADAEKAAAAASSSSRVLLYLDKEFYGTQKDCSLPLLMRSLGGTSTSWQSFNGILLDARYWALSRSGQEVARYAHRLIRLSPLVTTHSGMVGSVVTGSVEATSSSNANKQPEDRPEDTGLVAWWTFDDGPGHSVVTDVTRHRFKTPIHPALPTNSSSAHQTDGKAKNYTSSSSAPVATTSSPSVFKGGVLWDISTETGISGRYPLPLDLVATYKLWLARTVSSNNAGKIQNIGGIQNRSPVYPLSGTNTPHPTAADVTGGAESAAPAVSDRLLKAVSRVSPPWTQLLWQNMRTASWVFAETVPIFTTAINLHGDNKDKKVDKSKSGPGAKGGKTNAGVGNKGMVAARKIHIPPPRNKFNMHLKKPPALPEYLFAEQQMLRAQNDASSTGDAQGIGNMVVLPVPSFREQNLCLFTLRRHRLAKQGRQLYSLVPCPLQCGNQEIVKRYLRHHIHHVCPRRLIHCRYVGHCNGFFPAESQEEHEAQECRYCVPRNQQEHFWQTVAQWSRENLRPCPDCGEQVIILDDPNYGKEPEHDDADKGRTITSRYMTRPDDNSSINTDGDDNDDDDDGQPRLSRRQRMSLEQYLEHSRKSWQYHREQTCIFRKVYCPRKGCLCAEKSFPSTSRPPSAQHTETAGNSSLLSSVNTLDSHVKPSSPPMKEKETSSAPPPTIPFHRLDHHLRYECSGVEVQQRCVLISRSRSRQPYPRPWGLWVEMPKDSTMAQNLALSEDIPEPNDNDPSEKHVVFADEQPTEETADGGANGGHSANDDDSEEERDEDKDVKNHEDDRSEDDEASFGFAEAEAEADPDPEDVLLDV